MCGIAGILRVHPPGQAPPPPHVAIPEAWLDILDESVKHRGPDGHGRFRDRAARPDGSVVDVALVHRRLSIIDHAGGHQPMVLRDTGGPTSGASVQDTGQKPGATIDAEAYRRTAERALNPCPRCAGLGRGTIAVVFNGCIYNHRELREELQSAGHVFSTDHSDTEVLVHGWAEWGAELFAHLDAMYGIAIWDRRAGSVALARDLAGEKPLHVGGRTLEGGPVLFASTEAALLKLEAHATGATPLRDNQLWRGFTESWISIGWDRISPLGTNAQVRPGTVEIAPFECGAQARRIKSVSCVWRPGRRSSSRQLDPQAVETLIVDSVRSRLEADVSLAFFLSGGIDSSLIALVAARQGKTRTFTVRMPDSEIDESRAAARVARQIGSDHTTLDATLNPAGDLLRLIPQLGLPLGDSSLLPSAALCRAARSSTTVALGGDGGDELFGGYQRYQALALLSRFKILERTPARAIPSRRPRGMSAKAHRLVMAMRGQRYRDLLAIFPTLIMRQLLADSTWGAHDAELSRSHIPDALLEDFSDYLPHDLMTKSDTASMAVALEVRSPFLGRSLINAALSEPLASLMPHGQRKGLLRAVARKYFPPEIVDRPKQGFAIPIGEWFRSDYGGMRQLLLDHLNAPEPFGPDHLGINAMINMAYVRQMLREHDAAGVRSIWPWKGRDHSQRLYMMLVLSIWAKWLGSL